MYSVDPGQEIIPWRTSLCSEPVHTVPIGGDRIRDHAVTRLQPPFFQHPQPRMVHQPLQPRPEPSGLNGSKLA